MEENAADAPQVGLGVVIALGGGKEVVDKHFRRRCERTADLRLSHLETLFRNAEVCYLDAAILDENVRGLEIPVDYLVLSEDLESNLELFEKLFDFHVGETTIGLPYETLEVSFRGEVDDAVKIVG